MKKYYTVFLILFVAFTSYSQHKKYIKKTSITRSFISIKDYIKTTGSKPSDSLLQHKRLREGDTLIPISNNFYNSKRKNSVEYEPVDSTFLEAYKDVVYRKYQSKNNTASNKIRLRYWRNEIKIYFAKSLNNTVKKELKNFATYLSEEVDSLKISFVNKIEKSNYVIYGYDSINTYKYDNRLKSSKNDFFLSWNGNQWFYDCKLQINSDSYKNKEDLILKSKKLFLNTLGYFNYTKLLPKESYLSILYSKNKRFTANDLKILKYHYSFGICKGMDLNSFEETHKKALDVFKKTGNHLRIINKY